MTPVLIAAEGPALSSVKGPVLSAVEGELSRQCDNVTFGNIGIMAKLLNCAFLNV